MEVVLKLLNTPEHLEEKQLNLSKTTLMFLRLKKSSKIPYISKNLYRDIFLISNNDIHKSKDRFIYDRGSNIPYILSNLKIRVYKGNQFQTIITNKWMVGFKFGEFT